MFSTHCESASLPRLPASGARDAPQTNDAPLAGRHIALTWSAEQGQMLTSSLEAAGARVTPIFASAPAPVADTAALDAALLRLSRYDWVVLTSLAGVDAFAQRLAALGIGPEACRHVYIAMLFPLTARARDFAALPPPLVPAAVLADDIEMGLRDIAGKRILLLSAEGMRGTLAVSLRRRGAEVDDVCAYRMLAHPVDAQSLDRILLRQRVDAMICTSGEMAEGLLEGLAQTGPDPAEALRSIPLMTLEAGATATLRRAGLAPITAVSEAPGQDTEPLPMEALVSAVASATSAVPSTSNGTAIYTERHTELCNEGVCIG